MDDSTGTAVFYDSSYTAPAEQIIIWTWNFGDGSTGTGSQLVHQFSQPGEYYVCLTIETTDSCVSTYCQTIFYQGPNPCTGFNVSIQSVNPTTPNSNDGAAYLITSGGVSPYYYSWSTGETTQNISNLPEGMYNVAVMDGNSCEVFASAYLFADTTNQGTCNANFSYANSSGLITFFDNSFDSVSSWTWTFQNGSPSTSFEQNPVVYWQTTGTFEVCLAITTANGCSSTYCEFIYTSNCGISISGIPQGVSGVGQNDGSIDITVNGGTLPYYFYWSNGATTEDIADLASGNYYVTVYDAMQCSEVMSFTISDPNAPCDFSIFVNGTNPTGPNECNGTLVASTDLNSQAGVSFLWDNGATSPILTGLCYGTYCVMVTTATGCESTFCYFFNPGDSIYPTCYMYVDNTITNASSSGTADGSIDISVYGGTSPFSYNWNNGETTEDLLNIPNGIYSVNVIDAIGCYDVFTFSVGTVPVNNPVDTLWSNPIDTCIDIVDFYISDVNVLDSNYVNVTWTLQDINGIDYNYIITYLYDQTGYLVIYLNINCSNGLKSMVTLSDVIEVQYEMITGNNVVSPLHTKVYPNPFKDKITIEYTGEAIVNIFDITGKLVQEDRITGNKTITTDNLSDGVYILQILDYSGRRDVRKLIK